MAKAKNAPASGVGWSAWLAHASIYALKYCPLPEYTQLHAHCLAFTSQIAYSTTNRSRSGGYVK